MTAVLRESVCEILDPNQNGSIQAAQQRIDELARHIDELIKLATVPETAESAMTDIARFSDGMKSLRKFIDAEKSKQAATKCCSDKLNKVLQRLEKEDFTLTEYDDVVTRQLIERITVDDKDIIVVRFKGGFEMRKELDIEIEIPVWLYEMLLIEAAQTDSTIEAIAESAFRKFIERNESNGD